MWGELGTGHGHVTGFLLLRHDIVSMHALKSWCVSPGGDDGVQEGKRSPGRDLCVTGHVSVPKNSWGGRLALRGGCTLRLPSRVWGWIRVLPLKHPVLAKYIHRPRR